MSADENTPLLVDGDATQDESSGNGATKSQSTSWRYHATPELRILVACFLISTSLFFTQVPIIYAFRKMECEDFYSRAPPFEGPGDRCSRPDIDAGTALQMTILGLSSILCGVCNLLLTGVQIKKLGPRFSLLINTFFPILRVVMQAIGVGVGGGTGIIIMQSSQILAIVGGPAGYIFVLNSFIAEVVEPKSRTASFGKLQGAAMFGAALGLLLGGIVGELTIIRRPFEVTAGLLTLSCLFCFFFIPYIDPESMGSEDNKSAAPTAKKQSSFFLSSLGPQVLRLEDGRIVRTYAVTLLSLGIFAAGLAIGYAPVLTQMFAINEMGFNPMDNSVLMCLNSSMRGAFLLLAFPRIISGGRKWFATRRGTRTPEPNLTESIPTATAALNPIITAEGEDQPTQPPVPVDVDEGAHFDLWFLRWSLAGDALVTGCIGFATQPWHIYLSGAILPLFSGTDAASKGVLTEIIPASQRVDALQSLTLIQYVASLTTVGVFGLVYSALAAMGQGHLTFFCTAATAVVAIVILLFVRLPPKGSTVELGGHAEADVPSTPEALDGNVRE